LSEFFAMGGYAAFIWPAYGLTVLVIGGIVVDSFMRLRRVRGALTALERETQ
jgi:heme exporter protein D